MSEEKIQEEENNMYEQISGDEEDLEYSALSEAPPAPEGGVLKYDYADMERGVRPMSYHQDDYGGSGGSATGTSGSGAFQSNESGSDDDEYIEPVHATRMMVHQKQPKNQYVNTLDGKDLSHKTSPEMKGATIPRKSPSQREKFRKAFSPQGSKQQPNLGNSVGTNNNSELMDMLSRRKKKVESNAPDDEVFVKEEPPVKPPKAHPKFMYQVEI